MKKLALIPVLLASVSLSAQQGADAPPPKGEAAGRKAESEAEQAEGKPGWKLGIQTSATTALNAYSDSWEGGEAGSVNWTLTFDGSAEKQLGERVHNANSAKLSFGETHVQDKDTEKWLAPTKATDEIDLGSVLKLTLGAFVDPYVSLRLESSFWDVPEDTMADGSMEGDRYLNPVLITESFGAARTLVDKDPTVLQMRLGGAGRHEIERVPHPVDILDTTVVTNDFGLEYIAEFKTANKASSVNLSSKLRVFEALWSSTKSETDTTKYKDEWRYPDIDWENTLNINVTKYIMAGFTHQLLYDKEVHYFDTKGREHDARVRWRLTATIGVTLAYKN
jgi:hypothetical protein